MNRTRALYLWLLGVLLLAACNRVVAPPPAPTPTATAEPSVAAGAAATVPAATATGPAAPAAPLPSPTAVPFTPPDLRYLEAAFEDALGAFSAGEGTLAAYYVADLAGGQTIARNAGVALSGMSLVKIPILVEAYRALPGPPGPAETKLITETATLSGNYTANLLLERIAGRPDSFAGAVELTAALRQLGLYDTFIAVPYDFEPRADYLPTYATLANQATPSTDPDSSMQTTARDLGRLLTWIYRCRQGEGPLVAGPQPLAPADCEAILGVMAQNKIEAFIEAGVPAGVPVAHKHGWVGETHGDAGIVLAPAHPYVLVVALHRPGWLEWAESTALIERLSRLAYAHFTDPGAYDPAQLAEPLPPLSVPTATPALPRAVIAGTRGAGLTLRESPGGAEIVILPEGLHVYLLADPVEANGTGWQQVQLPDGRQGWVGAQFLAREQ